MIKLQQSQALTSHFVSFWSTVNREIYQIFFLFQKFGTKSGKPTEKISIIGSGELV